MTDKQKQKWQSRRWILCLWAVFYISIMTPVLALTGYDGAWVAGTMLVIAGIPVSYITISSLKKPKEGAL